MTQDEQNHIIRVLESRFDEPATVAFSKRIQKWAEERFGSSGKEPKLGSRGICVQYRVRGQEKWYDLNHISFTRFSWETNDDSRRKKENIQGLFFRANKESSNAMGDVIAVRYMPYISVNDTYRYKEDEACEYACSDTGKQRKWNHLEFRIYTSAGGGVRDYSIVKSGIHKGRNLCWYKPWHFSLEDEDECPVAPILVEETDNYRLVLRYRDKLYTMSMALDQAHTAELEKDVPVQPTHNWDSMWLRPPYTFTLVAYLSWKDKLYGSSDRRQMETKPHYVRTSDLPAGVRTREQIDHDAWEEGVRSGAIGRR